MADLIAEPVYKDTMQAMTTTTPGHCDQWNVRHQQLLNNDSWLKNQLEEQNAGLMSAVDKEKLDGIEAGANKTVVDTAMSATSTNPVQNKVVYAEVARLGAPVLIQEEAPSDTSALWVY